jgi:hypothetical protein
MVFEEHKDSPIMGMADSKIPQSDEWVSRVIAAMGVRVAAKETHWVGAIRSVFWRIAGNRVGF